MRTSIYTLCLVALISLLVSDAEAVRPSVKIITAEDILSGVKDESSTMHFRSEAGFEVEISLDGAGLQFSNPLAGDYFYPVSSAQINIALDEMRELTGIGIDATIYCLPGIPVGIGSSFATGSEIFLSATLAPASDEIIAYTLIHELGHIVEHTLIAGRSSEAWMEYLQIRNLSNSSEYSESALHRNRPSEIFAEDFRFIYGGPLATSSGSIENPYIALPQSDARVLLYLEEVLQGRKRHTTKIAMLGNVPNPFNPSTSIRFELDSALVNAGAIVKVEVFDLRGRRVWSSAGMPALAVMNVEWTGVDRRGMQVSSGRYAYRIKVSDQVAMGSMLLVE